MTVTSRKALLFALQPSKCVGTKLRGRMGDEVSLLVLHIEEVVPLKRHKLQHEDIPSITKLVFLVPAVF